MKPAEELERIHQILDEEGYFLKGPFTGLCIVPLLNAMADSAWDYPSAMAAIGGALLIPRWQDTDRWPLRGDHVGEYPELRKICPKVNDWEDAPIEWST